MSSQIPFEAITPDALGRLTAGECAAFYAAAQSVAMDAIPAFGDVAELVTAIHRLITEPEMSETTARTVTAEEAAEIDRIRSGARPRTLQIPLAVIREIDAHIDAATAGDYQAQPLASHWARITKVCEEAGEVWRALSLATGENPRKGVAGTWDEVIRELADVMCAAAGGIQHITKDEVTTAWFILAAFDKAYSRISGGEAAQPQEQTPEALAVADAERVEAAAALLAAQRDEARAVVREMGTVLAAFGEGPDQIAQWCQRAGIGES